MLFKLILVFGLCLFSTVELKSNPITPYVSKHITSLDGLAQNDVHNLFQDSQGFLWISTNDGLCRYDGSEFRTFSILDLGLTSNLILSVDEDSLGNLWVGTADQGVFCYNRKENHFYHHTQVAADVSIPMVQNTRFVRFDDKGRLWMYDRGTRQFVRYTFGKATPHALVVTAVDFFYINEENPQWLTCMDVTKYGIYVGTNYGLYRFNERTQKFLKQDHLPATSYINSLSSHDDKLIISHYNGFISYDMMSHDYRVHHLGSTAEQTYWSGDTLWVATKQGVYTSQYDVLRDEYAPFDSIDTYENISPSCMLQDKQGGMWVGHYKNGMHYYEPNAHPFYTYYGVGNDIIMPIYPQPDGSIWVGTDGCGMIQLDVTSQEAKVIRQLFDHTTIYSMVYVPQESSFYVASIGQVYRVIPKENYKQEPLNLNVSARKLLLDGDHLWICSYDNALIRLNLQTREQTTVTREDGLPSNIVRNAYLDDAANLWVCTSAGVAMIEASQKTALQPTTLDSLVDAQALRYTLPIHQASSGDIWFGTLGHGLFRLQKNPAADGPRYLHTHYTMDAGLPSNTIKALELDDLGFLWASTNKGMSRIDLNSCPKQGETELCIQNFNLDDGLQDYEFGELSSAKFKDGMLLFGGVSGINYFNPKNFVIKSHPLTPVISDFKVEGKSIYDDQELSSIMPNGLDGIRGFELNHEQNTFSIQFSGINFSNASNNRYRYYLEGVNSKWVDVQGGHYEVNYANLAPGKYVFHLRMANEQGVWETEELLLPIVIAPPFWATWYALCFYVLLLIIIVCSGFWYYHRGMKQRNVLALAQFEQRKMQEMLEGRTHFFTNISHEFRTPLTLILSPLQRMIEEVDTMEYPRWSSMLRMMEHNGNSLMRLINDFLNYTKQESGMLDAHLVPGNFSEFFTNLLGQFQYWATQRNIRLTIEVPEEDVTLTYDTHLMEQVINNLLSNALKYTPSEGQVCVRLELFEHHVLFSVHDTGAGIAEDQGARIFDRFYAQSTESSKDYVSSGVGLYLTKQLITLHGGEIWFESSVKGPDKGTTFYVKLPWEKLAAEGVALSEISSNESSRVMTSETEQEELPSLLLVEDHPELLEMLTNLFSESYEVITASDGQQAWDILLELQPDVVLSDVMMPRMNGLELCQRIKEETITSHIPVILLSAKVSDEDIAMGLHNCADAYCAKPFNNKVLLETVRSILQNRRRLASHLSSYRFNVNEVSPVMHEKGQVMSDLDRIFLEKLTTYIEENIQKQDLVINDLCKHMGITRFVLNKKLKSLIDATAITLIRTIRLHRAATLLRTSHDTIANVTYDVGFNDLKYFRECFKKEFGMSPQEYKEYHHQQAALQEA